MLQFKVEVISNDIVMSLHPPSPNPKTMALSFIDESIPKMHMPTLLIYTNNESTKTLCDNIINVLKASLSETLTHYYPLAGRLENEYTVSCNNKGIPFSVTKVDCHIKDFLDSSNKYDLVEKFFLPLDTISSGELLISWVVPLAIQVNLFRCGGIAIGCYYNHKLLDATSMSSFLNYWATHANGRYEDLVEPDFDTNIKLFPPISKETRAKIHDGNSSSDATTPTSVRLSQHLNVPIKVVARSFKFNSNVIKELKINGVGKTVPNPTSFEVVTGFVWKHVINAIIRSNSDNRNTVDGPIPTTVTFSAGLRSRITPSISKHCIGNITATVHACLGDEKGSYGDHKLHDMVRVIHAAVQMANQKLETMLGENGGEIYMTEGYVRPKASRGSCFPIFAWCKLGLNEVNFGFGKPTKVVPFDKVRPFARNIIMTLDYSDSNDDGIEVYVYLEENDMSFLEDNVEFKAFSKPS